MIEKAQTGSLPIYKNNENTGEDNWNVCSQCAWSVIAKVKNTEGGGLKNHTFYDDSPDEGENIYRINLLTKEGVVKQNSEIIKVNHLAPIGDFVLYPNPARDFVNIVLPDIPTSETTINILNLNGQVVKTVANIKEKSFEIDLNDLPSGQYLICVSQKGKRDFTKRLIIIK